ncbi:hypothetical protein ACFE04_016831 [Oxalis oulophora]
MKKLSLLLLSLSILFTLSLSSSTFSPIDNYLINCGSFTDSIIDNRRFTSDHSSDSTSILFNDYNPFPNLPQIYHSAKILNSPSKYHFIIKDPGTHTVRLHFHQFKNSPVDISRAQFHVLVNGYVVLSNFSVQYDQMLVVKEYFIWASSEKLVITFVPAKRSNFAFINAIEVISAPKDVIVDTANYLNGDNKVDNFDGLSKQAFEVMYRINVGGVKVTPFNDTLWRTWIPDDEFLTSDNGFNRVHFGGRIKYVKGGASREVGPDNVYNTARVITSKNSSIPKLNMTWDFTVVQGYKYLVRMHFCDIASISLNLMYFNVYINGNLAYEDMDISKITGYLLASPFYTDFVVESGSSGVLSISVGPSSKSIAPAVDGLLNGVEILKMNNSMGSLDGLICPGLALKSWHTKNIGVLVPFIAIVCILLSIGLAMHRKIGQANESPAWLRLPVVDTHEQSLKDVDQNAIRYLELQILSLHYPGAGGTSVGGSCAFTWTDQLLYTVSRSMQGWFTARVDEVIAKREALGSKIFPYTGYHPH